MRRVAQILVPAFLLALTAGGAAALETRTPSPGELETSSLLPMSLSGPPEISGLTLTGFEGREALSSLYSFRLDLVAPNSREVSASALLGKELGVSVALPGGRTRHFSGIVSRFTQGDRRLVTRYQAEIVPKFWLLTRTADSRIFQEMSVPEILARVLGEVPGLAFEMRLAGTFQPRNYCVQYRETDFAFASRLMEEEGIFYFFRHAPGGHTMVLANTPEGHPDLPGVFPYVFGTLFLDRPDSIQEWGKMQEIRSGKYTLWDHNFELPHQNLEAIATIQESVLAGEVTHDLKAGGNDALEVYDYPGRYAQRFDGIDPGGGEQPAELQKIFEDGQRTVGIRMQEEAAQALVIRGESTAPSFSPGHRFQLARHFDGDGPYVLTGVHHTARAEAGGAGFTYANRFECIPAALPFRPERTKPKPVIPGTQTAVVVGPPGEEIFTDKYGRVKVQFHWDREGRNDADSSCWIRVASLHAGTESGSIFIPRIGWEVVVSFLEGDPDRPIIVGSVYNPELLPPPTDR